MLGVTRRWTHQAILAIGLVLLAVANVAHYVIQRNHLLGESAADGLSGFLFGVAIGTTCLGIWMQGRALRRRGR